MARKKKTEEKVIWTADPPPPPPDPQITARQKIDNFGIDRICEMLTDGRSMAQVAVAIGVTVNSLRLWKIADQERATIIQAAQDEAGEFWDRKAEQEIAAAQDQFELQKARELAVHYRWRAKALSRNYIERKQVDATVKDVTPMRTPEERAAEIRKLHEDHPELRQLIH